MQFNWSTFSFHFLVTVQCTRDGQFVIVAARDSTLPRLSLDSIFLLGGRDPPCAPVGTTVSFAIYQFPVTACGTTMMVSTILHSILNLVLQGCLHLVLEGWCPVT